MMKPHTHAHAFMHPHACLSCEAECLAHVHACTYMHALPVRLNARPERQVSGSQ